MAAGVFLAILALYLWTLAPTTQFWDTSEYIAAAKVLGIPHPPGNPLFVLIANVWGMIPWAASYALRINLLSAVSSALASGFLFLVAERFLREILPEPRWLRRAAAAAGILVGATAFTVWNQSVVNEKVYTLSLLSIALILWLAVHWGDQPAGQRRDHWLLVIVYVTALSATNHLMGVLVAPAILVYVLYTDPSVLLRWRMWLAAVAVGAIGLSVNLFLPLRAAHYPPINEGEPVCSSIGAALEAIYTFGALGCEPLADVLNREQYQKPPVLDRQADILWQYANYLQYFTWQFARDWSDKLEAGAAALFAMVGLGGAARHWQRDRRGALAMLALIGTVTVLLVFYLNFKYGYSIRPGENLTREVRERDYFFVASFQLWGVWVALGIGTLAGWAMEALRERQLGDPALLASPVLLLALIPLVGNRETASRAGEWLPRDLAWDMLQSVEPYGILVTTGDNDTFPLWYIQEVEQVRQDVLIVNLSLANTEWHPRQLKRRPTFPFDTAAALPIYRDREWPAPDQPALLASYEQIDAIPLIFAVPQDRRQLRVGSIRATIDQNFLQRSDVITLQVIQDNLGKRPIYFSRTVGPYADGLGLTPYLLGHGLVRKLMPDSLQASDTVKLFPALGWVDIERTRSLLFEVYHPESAARPRPQGWPDPPSDGILSLYALMYATYSDYLRAEGDTAAMVVADRAADLAKRIFTQTRFYTGP
jgi:hypothetical protein